MNSGICPAFDTSSPQACDCNDGRRSYLSISERQSVESILVAALKGGILNSSFNSNGGHGVNTNCFVRPNVYSSFLPSHAGQYDLAMLALARPIDLLVALHLAIPTAGTFWPMTPNVQNSLPINIYPQGMARHVLPTDRRKPSFGQALSLLLGKDKASWPVDLIHRLQDIRCQHLNLSLTDTGNNDFSASRAVVDLVKHKNNEDTLITLGSKCLERRRDKVPYFDASTLMDPDSAKLANRRRGGGVLEPFPEKLYRMIMEACSEGKEGVISFFPHGRAFGIHNPERFEKEILPTFFKQSRISSFQRQLNLYGFTRINTGPDAGGYYHELFLRGRPALGTHIRRVGVPQAVPRKRGVKTHDASVDPDFYGMPPLSGVSSNAAA